MMMISEEFLVKNLSPQKSDIENIFHQIALNLTRNDGAGYNRRGMISLKNLGSVFMVVEGDRDMGLLVADIVFTVEENMDIRFGMDMMDAEQMGFKLWRNPN